MLHHPPPTLNTPQAHTAQRPALSRPRPPPLPFPSPAPSFVPAPAPTAAASAASSPSLPCFSAPSSTPTFATPALFASWPKSPVTFSALPALVFAAADECLPAAQHAPSSSTAARGNARRLARPGQNRAAARRPASAALPPTPDSSLLNPSLVAAPWPAAAHSPSFTPATVHARLQSSPFSSAFGAAGILFRDHFAGTTESFPHINISLLPDEHAALVQVTRPLQL